MQKKPASSIHAAVSIQYQIVTDGQTYTQTQVQQLTLHTALAQRRAVNRFYTFVTTVKFWGPYPPLAGVWRAAFCRVCCRPCRLPVSCCFTCLCSAFSSFFFLRSKHAAIRPGCEAIFSRSTAAWAVPIRFANASYTFYRHLHICLWWLLHSRPMALPCVTGSTPSSGGMQDGT